MSIDTLNKKLALITYQQPFNTPIPISSDGIGQDDKQHLLWQYPGILWVTSIFEALINFTARNRAFNFSGRKKSFAFDSRNKVFNFTAREES